MRRPRVGAHPPAIVGTEDRSPDRPLHLFVLRGLAGDRDRFVEPFELAPALRRSIATWIGGIDVEDIDRFLDRRKRDDGPAAAGAKVPKPPREPLPLKHIRPPAAR